jgi:hypothetical protein
MRRFFTRGDIILIIILLLLSVGSLGALRGDGFAGNHAVVEVNGKRTLELPLDRDTMTTVDGPLGKTTISVHDGSVEITDSPCPRGLCKHMGHIRCVGEVLVCVPNRVFVTIIGDRGGENKFDGVSE